MYYLRIIDYDGEKEIFTISLYAPPSLKAGDEIQVAKMEKPDFPYGMYHIQKIDYDFNTNGFGDKLIFITYHVFKMTEE